MSVRCLCINDSNRPKEIKPSLWVKKDQEYHITHIYWHYQQKIQGVELAEIELTDECFPYQSFALNRFGIYKEDMEKFIQMIKDCTELNDIEISNLIEELNLETV